MDRKGWIIIVLCSIGLVGNFYISSLNKKALKAGTEQNLSGNSPTEVVRIEATRGGQSTTPVIATAHEEKFQLEGKDAEGKVCALFHFTNRGGGIDLIEFPQYDETFGNDKVKLNKSSTHVVGALARNYDEIERTLYTIASKTSSSITFVGKLASGLKVEKRWSLDKDSKNGYQIDLNLKISNESSAAVSLSKWSLFSGTAAPLHGDELRDKAGWFYYHEEDFEFEQQSAFKGGWFSKARPVEQIKVNDLEFVGVANQFFSTILFPKGFEPKSLWATGVEADIAEGDEMKPRWVFSMGMSLPDYQLGPAQEKSYQVSVFTGPRKRKLISSLSTHSKNSMAYGIFAPVATFMSFAINKIHGWFEGRSYAWGIAIILLTVFIRIIIWPLHNISTRTMKRMSKLQPLMKEIKEKYKDNPQKMNQETMGLYKKYGINPMGGCIPMLFQIPIFFGVFKMLGSAVEMRGSEFLWVKDLSMPDTVSEFLGLPINLLPIFMAVTMVLQMRMTPQSGDKLQRRIFMLMPLMFFFFCYNYASALALYWTTQNIVSIGQTWLMQRLPEAELKDKSKGGVDDKSPRKKGFFEKMAEKMEAVQQQQEQQRKGEMRNVTQTKKAKKRGPKTGG